MPTTKTNVPKNEESELYTPITPAETNSIRSIKNPIGVQLFKVDKLSNQNFSPKSDDISETGQAKGSSKKLFPRVFGRAKFF